MVSLWWFGLAVAAERRTPVVIAVEKATPAVVIVEGTVERQNPFFGWGTVGASQGSGVVIDAKGIVLTNAHVVEGAHDIVIHTVNGDTWPADVMALEADSDLAVLQVRGAPPLPTIPIGSSEDLMLGETVIAIGNAMGLGITVSTGVVSSIRRDVEVRPGLHQSFIQTDAAINPGNSGGALVNLDGALIGINTAIRADAEGIGFAIPVDRARKIAQDLVNYGSVREPWLGIDVVDLDARALRGTPLEKGAVLVRRVHPGGPGAAAGLQEGDLVYQVQGQTVASRADLNSRLASHTPGDRIAVGFLRKGKTGAVTVASTGVPEDAGRTSLAEVLGIGVVATAGGLVVDRASALGAWRQARLDAGDVILAVDGRAVRTVDELEDALARARAQHRGSALFTVRRGPYQGHVAVAI